jgi:hypothetical protein
MRQFLQILSIFLALLITSCSGNKDKKKQEKIIPAKDLITILTELYVADGLLAYPPVRAQFFAKDSIINYIEIIERHGYTKERMDKTIHYYFQNNPEKLEKIYDQVLARLSETEAKLKEPVHPAPVNTFNLWKGESSISVPETGVNNRIWFDIPVKDTGNYKLDLTAILYADDQSLNPRINIYFWHADSTKKGVSDNWNFIILLKDGHRHIYSITKKLSDTTFTHIRGYLLDHDPKPGTWVKHAKVEDITLMKASAE